MALSTLSRAMRPSLMGRQTVLLLQRSSVPMATAAKDQMQEYWDKNQRLGRPNSPWLIYKWPLTMASSFAHRVSGVGLGLTLYAASMGLAMAPGDFASYMEFLQGLELGPAVWVPFKTFAGFCVTYKCLSGSRHLFWDFKGGYEIKSQNMSAYCIWGTALSTGLVLALAPYFF